MSLTLERALSRFRRTPADGVGTGVRQQVSAAAFRARIETRMSNLERDVGDLKGRLNGLIFVVIGAVVTQLLLGVAQ